VNATGRLPIEHAWRTIADGLHIHRWYLHPAPMLRARAAWLRAAHGLPPETPTGWIEHLCHPAQGAGPVAADRMSTVDLCGTRVAVMADVDCFVDPLGFRIARAAALRGRPRLPSDVAAEIGRAVHAAELAYLVEVGVSVLVRADEPVLCPPGTVAVPAAGSAVELAAGLLAEAAVCWLRAFALSAPESGGTEPVYDPAAWAHAVPEAAEHGIRLAVQIRLYEALAGVGTEPERTLAKLRDEAARTVDAVYATAERLPLIACDFLVTMFPGPQRFAKYTGGGGAGQSHWPAPEAAGGNANTE
jgi:hypothetical protein